MSKRIITQKKIEWFAVFSFALFLILIIAGIVIGGNNIFIPLAFTEFAIAGFIIHRLEKHDGRN